MIINTVFHYFKKAVSYLIIGIAWLLISLSLWVPFLYSLIFILICASMKISLSSVSTIYYTGLILTFLISFAISHYFYEKKRTRKKGILVASEKVNQKTDEVRIEKKREVEEESKSDETQEGEDGKFSFPSTYGLDSDSIDDIRLSGERNEVPMIFALRRDPTIFIYEYKDRLDYYKKTRQGMVFIESVRRK